MTVVSTISMIVAIMAESLAVCIDISKLKIFSSELLEPVKHCVAEQGIILKVHNPEPSFCSLGTTPVRHFPSAIREQLLTIQEFTQVQDVGIHFRQYRYGGRLNHVPAHYVTADPVDVLGGFSSCKEGSALQEGLRGGRDANLSVTAVKALIEVTA